MEAPELLNKEDFKSIKTVRELCSIEIVKVTVPVELEIRYIATFINNNRDTWAEIMMFHPETREHFKDYEQSEISEDGTSWLSSNNFWD